MVNLKKGRMKKNIMVMVCLLGISMIQNCVPALIASAAYSGSKKRQSHQEWTAQFNQTNLEREKAKLKPLDFCDEAIKYDKKWALKNDECKSKFQASEKP